MYRAILFSITLAAAYGNPPHPHAGSGVVALDVVSSGEKVDLLIAEQRAATYALFHFRSLDGGETWTVPVRIPSATPFGARRGNDPQIASAGDRLVAVWTTAGTDKWGSGPLATAVSSDGGKTWEPGPNPADDGATTGHGFADIAADMDGRFNLVWLDSRDGKQGLRYASSADGKKWNANVTVKPGTCECCANTLATAGGQVAVIYRGHDPRDMYVATSLDAGAKWTRDSRAGGFDWKFDGCPHAGGGIAFTKGALHALVWTGAADHTGVYYLNTVNGEAWSPPLRLGPADATHPDIASDGRRLAAVWESGGEIWGSRSNDGAKWSTPIRLSGKNATHARVVVSRGGFRAFWTETPEHQDTVWKSQLIGVK